MTPEFERDKVLRAARRVGARIERQGFGSTAAGRRAVGRVVCRDGWHAGQFLVALGEEDARSPDVHAIASAIRKQSNGDGDYASAVHAMVRERVRFVPEVGEIFTSPGYSLAAGYGDCDDHARLVYSLLRAGGVPARMGFLYRDGQTPSHVAAQAGLGGLWHWLETTVDAEPGEHPLSAATRLGVLGARDDLSEKETTMSKDDLPPAPSSLRSTRDEVEGDQRALFALGYYTGPLDGDGLSLYTRDAVARFQRAHGGLTIDGLTGPRTRAALASALVKLGDVGSELPLTVERVQYTKDLSVGFFTAVKNVAAKIGARPEHLLAVMHSESGLRSDAKNRNGAGAYGLIQFMAYGPRNAPVRPGDVLYGVGWRGTPDAFLKLTAEQQMPYVEKFFVPWAPLGLGSSGRLYQATFLPGTLKWGSDPSTKIAVKDGTRFPVEASAYRDNKGFDADNKGWISVGDLDAAIARSSRGERWNEALARLGATPKPAIDPGRTAGAIAVLGGSLWSAAKIAAAIALA